MLPNGTTRRAVAILATRRLFTPKPFGGFIGWSRISGNETSDRAMSWILEIERGTLL